MLRIQNSLDSLREQKQRLQEKKEKIELKLVKIRLKITHALKPRKNHKEPVPFAISMKSWGQAIYIFKSVNKRSRSISYLPKWFQPPYSRFTSYFLGTKLYLKNDNRLKKFFVTADRKGVLNCLSDSPISANSLTGKNSSLIQTFWEKIFTYSCSLNKWKQVADFLVPFETQERSLLVSQDILFVFESQGGHLQRAHLSSGERTILMHKNFLQIAPQIVAEYSNQIMILDKKKSNFYYKSCDFEGNVTSLSLFPFSPYKAQVGNTWSVYRGVLYFMKSGTHYSLCNNEMGEYSLRRT